MRSRAETTPVLTGVVSLSRIARLWQKLRLMDVVLLTSVPLLTVGLLIGDGIVSALRYSEFDDYWTEKATVGYFLNQRAKSIISLPGRVALRQGFDPDASDPGIIRINVPRRRWDEMRANSQSIWNVWVDAQLTYGATSLDVRLRKRGDNSLHWLTDKHSLTVRTSRDEFYKTYREFGLSAKSVLPSYLANRLAQEFGLLVPDTAVVAVYLNSQFYGMFRFLQPVDESFIRAAGRMPGSIFRGDAAERGEFHKSVPRSLFVNPYIWDRVAQNDRWTAAPPNQLHLMLEDLQGGTFEDHQRLMARFDRDEYARLFAYFMLVGDPFDASSVHNQFLYEDPSTQRLHPIPWDIRLRDVTIEDVGFNDLFRELLRDPWLTDRIMHEVARSVSDSRIKSVAERLVVDIENKYGDYLKHDRMRTGLVPDVGTAEQSLALIQANVRTVRRWLTDEAVAFAVGSSGLAQVVDIETRGLVGVDLLALDQAISNGRPKLYRDRNRNGRLDPGDPEVPTRLEGSSLILDRPLPLLAAWDTAAGGFDPGRMPYRFFVLGVTEHTIRPRLEGRITGKPPATQNLVPGQAMAAEAAWHPWRLEETAGSVRRFSGDVHVSETIRIPAEDTVIVEAGTSFRVDAEVSFISRGVVRFEGSPDRPIQLIPSEPGRPWGAFSLLGSGANGSVIRHAEFVEGGGALVDRIEYTGMVNVHRAEGVVFDSVLFRSNRSSDDAFHALHSEITLTNSRFVDVNTDAVDLDISTGELRGNLFDGSGGDAIDLMTSAPRIVGNRIRNAGDKGISVGEASSPVIFANVIEDSVIGIEIKDRSAPVVLNNEIRGSGVGLGSHAKNWRYAGSGFGFLANTRFAENEIPFDADITSRLTAVGVASFEASAVEPDPAALPWLYQRLGIEVQEPSLGVPSDWRTVAVIPPLDELRFVDDFESVADGWVGGPRVTRLEKRNDVLVVEVEGGTGSIGRGVRWDLVATNGGILVVELAGRDLQQVRIEAEGGRASVGRDVTVPPDSARFMVVELPLPADHYRRVTIKLEPTLGLSHIQRSTGLSVVRAGRLFLRSVTSYPVSRDSEQTEGTR